jgi:hypothetical protein
MLTNPWETQLVRTLGVKVGSAPVEAPAPFAAVRAGLARQRDTALVADPSVPGRESAATPTAAAPATEGPGCPFAAMIGSSGADAAASVPWTTEAESRLDRIPTFIRPMARQAIERFARERGHTAIDAQVMDQARDFMGM